MPLAALPCALLLLLLLPPALPQPPTLLESAYIVHATYVENSIDTVPYAYGVQSAVVRGTFDEDLYVRIDSGCAGERTELASCSSVGVPGGPVPNAQCVDEAFEMPLGKFSGQDYVIFYGQVKNYDVCSALVVSLPVVGGYQVLMVDVGSDIQTVTSYNDIFNNLIPSDTLLSFSDTGSKSCTLCCDSIRSLNPTWDGSFWALVYWGSTNSFRAVFPVAPLVPLHEWYWGLSFQLNCSDGFYCSSAPDCSLSNNCCVQATSTYPLYDPYYHYFVESRNTENSEAPVIRKDSVILTVVVYEELLNESPCRGFPDSRLPLCSIAFNNIRSHSGELSNGTYYKLTKEIGQCNYTKFLDLKNEYDESLEDVNLVADNSTAVEIDINTIQSLVLKEDWYFCTVLADSLLQTSTETVLTVTTSECPWDPILDQQSYLTDPCCNTKLQLFQCCPREQKTIKFNELAVHDNVVANTCATKKCSAAFAANYANLKQASEEAQLSTSCFEIKEKELQDPAFFYNPLVLCGLQINGLTCYFDSDCQSLPNSRCIQGYCSISCVNSSTCYGRPCISNSCKIIPNVQVDRKEVLKCVLDKGSSTFNMLMTEHVSKRDTRPVPVETKLEDFILPYVCYGMPSKITPPTNQQDCEDTQVCNWMRCLINNSTCTEDICLQDRSSNYCASCTVFESCSEKSIFSSCQVVDKSYWNNKTLCEMEGYIHTYENTPNGVFSVCKTSAPTMEDCFAVPYPEAMIQTSFCVLPLNATECIQAAKSLHPWTNGNQTGSICVDSSILNYTYCTQTGGSWFPGLKWPNPLYNDIEKCGLCRAGPIYLDSSYTRSTCNASLCSNECGGCNQTVCESSGICFGDADGCLLPYEVNLENYTTPCFARPTQCFPPNSWTPRGCINAYITKEDCDGLGGTWLTMALTEEECNSKMPPLCLEGALTTFEISSLIQIPDGYTLKDPQECLSCNGTVVPFYIWEGGEWFQTYWGQDLLRWIPRQVTHGSWKYSIDFKNFENLLTTLRSKRLSSISKNELVCRYGVLKDTLELLACDCSGTGSNCSSKLASTLSSNNHVLSVCTGIPYVSTTNNVQLIIPENLDFADETTFCIDIFQYFVSINQFKYNQIPRLNGFDLVPDSQKSSGDTRKVHNGYGVVVGEWIGDAYGWKYNATVANSTILACMTLDTFYPLKTFLITKDFKSFFFDEDRITYKNQNNTVCINVVSDEYYIPVGLKAGWQTMSYLHSWTLAELIIMGICLCLYLILLIISIFSLLALVRNNSKYTMPIISVSLVTVTLTDRAITMFYHMIHSFYPKILME